MYDLISSYSINMDKLSDFGLKILSYFDVDQKEVKQNDYAKIYKCNYLVEKLVEKLDAKDLQNDLSSAIDTLLSNGSIKIGFVSFERSLREHIFFDDNNDSSNSETEEQKKAKNIESLKEQIRDWILSDDIILPQEIQAKVATYDSSQIESIKKLPWFNIDNKSLNIKEAETILNKNIYGLDEVKTQILQYIAAQINTESSLGTVLLFDGPPGIGKTSIASAIAEAMNRKLYTIKIPAYSTAWEICGLDKSWKGAKPGLIIDALITTQSFSPVILLDEIDKIESTQKDTGNISAALLTVLDSERSHYVDSFLQLEIDLSKVVFLATSNDINKINPVLLDRLKIISLKGYTADQKKKIAQSFIIPQKRKIYNLSEDDLIIEDNAIKLLLQQYATEPGVRVLMHDLDTIFSYASKYKLDYNSKLCIDESQISSILGEPRVKSYSVGTIGGIGDCFSMNYRGINGQFDIVQATVYPGTGKIIQTGVSKSLHIKESIAIVISHIKKFSLLYGIEYNLLNTSDIHINFLSDSIANPKEYALAIFVAIICAFKGWATRSWVFLGRLTLNGTVIPPESLFDKISSFVLSDKVEKFVTSNMEAGLKDKPITIPQDKEVIYVNTTMEVFEWLQKELETK